MPEPGRRRSRRCADDRRLPDRAPVADGAGPRQGRFDAWTPAFSTAISSSSKRRAAAKRGDIVVAIVDGQFTLKRLDLERGQFVLKPENKAYPVIRPEGTLEIFGVMVGLVRKL